MKLPGCRVEEGRGTSAAGVAGGSALAGCGVGDAFVGTTCFGTGVGVALVIWGVGVAAARWVSGANAFFVSSRLPVGPADFNPLDDQGVGLGSGLADPDDVKPIASVSLLKKEGRALADLGCSSPGAFGVGVGRAAS